MIRWILAATTAFVVAALAVPALRHWRERPPLPPPPVRTSWLPAESIQLGAGAQHPFGLALAPDGRRLVYPAARSGDVSLWLQDLSTNDTRALPGTDGAAQPFWSPDGRRIGFFASGRIRAFDLASGSITDLADTPNGRGAAWNAAGDLVFAPDANGGLMRRAADGAISSVTTVDAAQGEASHGWPAFLPDGRHVVFFVAAASSARGGAWVVSIDDPSARRRLAATDAQAIVSGQTLLYSAEDALLAQALDPATWTPAGQSVLAGLPVGRGPLDQLFATASPDVLIYGAPGTTLRQLQWVSADGSAPGGAGDPLDAWDVRISPTDGRVLITGRDPQLGTLDVWIREASQLVPLRLSPSTNADEGGVWSPDGTRVAWTSARRAVTIRGAGAVLDEQTLATFEPPVSVWDWSRDGTWLVVGRTAADTRSDLWLVPVADGTKARAYTSAPFNEMQGTVSPDSRWMAYASDESGHFDIYIDSFPVAGTRIRVTTAGGTEPRWRRDGAVLYFRRGSAIHAVSLVTGLTGLEARATATLFDAGADLRSYDVTADGRRFLLNLPAASAAPRAATVVVNWLAPANRELTQRRR